jgi:hypothetical protein
MFAVMHSDINSLKSGLLHLSGQPCCKKSRSAKVKDGIIILILRDYLIDQYKLHSQKLELGVSGCQGQTHKGPYQGTLTERKGSVQLTSLY